MELLSKTLYEKLLSFRDIWVCPLVWDTPYNTTSHWSINAHCIIIWSINIVWTMLDTNSRKKEAGKSLSPHCQNIDIMNPVPCGLCGTPCLIFSSHLMTCCGLCLRSRRLQSVNLSIIIELSVLSQIVGILGSWIGHLFHQLSVGLMWEHLVTKPLVNPMKNVSLQHLTCLKMKISHFCEVVACSMCV